MSQEKYYGGPKEMSGMLKSLFRNQSIFSWRAAKQVDLKANMLISLSFYLWVGIILINLNFDTYLHFPQLLMGIPWLLSFMCIIKCIRIVAPNTRFLRRIFTKELEPTYPEGKFNNMYRFNQTDLDTREADFDAMMEDHSLQIGNIIRGHYVSSRYLAAKWSLLDKAYNYFLATIASLFILFAINLVASRGHMHEHTDRHSYAQYDFESPQDIFVLDRELEEVSGLAYGFDDQLLYTINDEKGKVYKLSPRSGDIVDTYKFAGKGDYEGIEVIDDMVLVTNSSGDIFISNEDNKAIVQHTPMGPKNDVEGLGFDPKSDLILMACKGEPWLPIEGDKAIYIYNQELHRLDSTVYLDIKISDLQTCVDSLYQDDAMRKGLKRRLREFAPSAVAIQPSTRDIYVLTAHGSLIAVYDKDKRIRDVIRLNEIICPQPEGICFDLDGHLYISTEGHGGSGKIFKYTHLESN